MERGLVDQMGTLEDAVERAQALSGLNARFRRRDISGQPPRSYLQRMVSDTLKEAVPQVARASLLVDRLLGTRTVAMLELLIDHDGEALALLPVDIHPR